jgi:hypothetical protein|tara:strand:- start:878 stop:1123 length:246 start_codon:yes stop_codon:yes gene_type:complete
MDRDFDEYLFGFFSSILFACTPLKVKSNSLTKISPLSLRPLGNQVKFRAKEHWVAKDEDAGDEDEEGWCLFEFALPSFPDL